MRYLIVLIILLVGLWFFISSDYFKGLISNAIPGVAMQEEDVASAKLRKDKESSAEADQGQRVPGASSSASSSSGGGGTGQVQAIQMDRSRLVGGWLAENGGEFMILRSDGKARVAIAWRYETNVDDLAAHHATVTGKAYGEWELNNGFLAINQVKFEQMDLKNLKFVPKSLKKQYDPWQGVKVNTKFQSEVEPKLKGEANRWLLENHIGGAITQMTDRIMVVEYKSGPIAYERVDPYFSRDPDGTNGPVFVEDPATGKYRVR